jgi:hypothetical protein
LRLSEGAVEARLHRGKAQLRQLLCSDLRPAAESLGILLPAESGWHPTRIWCPFCGRHPLLAYLDPAAGTCHYRCAGACIPTGTIVGGERNWPGAALTSPKAILNRLLPVLHTHYQQASRAGGQPCPRCGRLMPLECWTDPHAGYAAGIAMGCARCRVGDNASLWHLALDTPAAQRFWKQHPRMRALPPRTVDHAGRPALLGGFESLTGTARLDVLFDPGDLQVLGTGEGA